MAITKIFTINQSTGSVSGKYLKQALVYIADGNKTQNGRYVGSINCQLGQVYEEMLATKKKFGKTDKRQAYHVIISFEEQKLDPAVAFEIAGEFVQEFLGENYEALFSVHDNTEHTHVHIIFNSVNCLTGKKFRYEKGDWAKNIQPITNRLCKKHGLSVIDVSVKNGEKQEYYKDWNEFRDGEFIWREMIAKDVDACILQAADFEEFLTLLREREYEIKQNKYLAIRPKGMQRFCRCKSLGGEYTEENIRKRIEAEDKQQQIPKDIPEESNKAGYPSRMKGMQKVYYQKVCTIQRLKKRPYSKAYKYREDIRKLHEWNERYLFLLKYDVHDLTELENVQKYLADRKQECQAERTFLNKEKRKYKEVMEIAYSMEQLLPAEHCFQKGDTFFQREHDEYKRLEQILEEAGYSLEDVLKLEQKLKKRAAGNYEQRKAVQNDYKIAGKILSEYETKILQWYKKQEKEEQENREQDREQPKQR